MKMKMKVGEGVKTFGTTKKIGYDKSVSLVVKRVLYDRVVMSTMTYGVVAGGMREEKIHKYVNAKVKYLRSMIRVIRIDKTGNKKMRCRRDLREKFSYLGYRKFLNWFGRVYDMSEHWVT